jgi:hypothetical protein
MQREPQRVLQWLVNNSDRAFPWHELGAVLHGRGICDKGRERGPSSVSETVDQMPISDVAKAEGVVGLLGFPECVLDMVVLALLDTGCDARCRPDREVPARQLQELGEGGSPGAARSGGRSADSTIRAVLGRLACHRREDAHGRRPEREGPEPGGTRRCCGCPRVSVSVHFWSGFAIATAGRRRGSLSRRRATALRFEAGTSAARSRRHFYETGFVGLFLAKDEAPVEWFPEAAGSSRSLEVCEGASESRRGGARRKALPMAFEGRLLAGRLPSGKRLYFFRRWGVR